MGIKEFVADNAFKRVILLDGGAGTTLQKSGVEVKQGEISELIGFSHPDVIINMHKSYIEAGSEIIYTNTFNTNRFKAEKTPYSVRELVLKSVSIAREAADSFKPEREVFVALDIGPTGKILEPLGDISFDDLVDVFKEIVSAGKEGGADLVVLETFSDLSELRAGIIACKEASDLPFIATMTFEESGRTYTGCGVASMALMLEGLGALALGVNCSLGPAQLYNIVKELTEWTKGAGIPVIVKPNAGLPDSDSGDYQLSGEDFAAEAGRLIQLGANFVGGCCGTTFNHIKCVKTIMEDNPHAEKAEVEGVKLENFISSSSKIAELTPEKAAELKWKYISHDAAELLYTAVKSNEFDDVVDMLFDVMGEETILPLDFSENYSAEDIPALIKCYDEITMVCSLPLMIHTSSEAVLEVFLRRFAGKAAVSISENAENDSSRIQRIKESGKKYGCLFI